MADNSTINTPTQIMKIRSILTSTLLSVAILFSCASNKSNDNEKPKYLWFCLDANFERFSNQDTIKFYLDKALETGFNHIVVDVRGVDGYVAYKSEILPELKEVDGFRVERDWDYLQFFIDQAESRGMGVSVSASIFPSGSPAQRIGPIYESEELADLASIQHTPDQGELNIMDDPTKVGAFLNPILPESRQFAKSYIAEILTNYKFDAFVLDYCRFQDLESDFSLRTKGYFEEFVGATIENWPADVFTYDENGMRVPGRYYKQWWEFRSRCIRDFIADVRLMCNELQPGVELEYWAASWLHAIYTQGQNWASPRSRFYDQYTDDWASETYYKSAFADQLDVFITGTYLNKVWGMDDLESIEYGLMRSNRDVMGDCKVYGSLYAMNHHEEFADAVYLCLDRTQGLMVFDIVQVIRFDLWDEIKAGIDRAESQETNI